MYYISDCNSLYFPFRLKLSGFYNLYDLIQNDFFAKKTRIIVLHSGGLQGVNGFNLPG